MTKVARRHGVSSSFMARVCDRMNVPRPPRGYWAQLAAGKASAKPDLPPPRLDHEIEWVRDGEQRTTLWDPPAALTKETPPEPLPAKSSRRSLHSLIAGARPHFEKVRSSDNGYLRPYKKLLVDVYVSSESLDRALAIANHTFLALEERGYAVSLARSGLYFQRPELDERLQASPNRYNPNGWSPERPTVTFVGTVAFGLTVYELSEHVEAKYSNGVYVRVVRDERQVARRFAQATPWVSKHEMPSGLLGLRATSPYPVARWEKSWRESRRGELKSMIPDIIRELEADAALLAELVRIGEEKAEAERAEWEEQSRRWKLEEQERQRAKAISASSAELLSIIEDWARAKRIEDFFDDVLRRSSSLSEDERQLLAKRALKARAMLGGVDALEKLRQWRTPEEFDHANS
jgi:hypothetical protein